jgi:hypothetical protein
MSNTNTQTVNLSDLLLKLKEEGYKISSTYDPDKNPMEIVGIMIRPGNEDQKKELDAAFIQLRDTVTNQS